MDRIELVDLAEQVLSLHKENLLIDPFARIKVEVTEGDFVSKCISDKSAMSWIIQLNPERHNDLFDIQYSIIESLFGILFDDFKMVKDQEGSLEVQRRIIARLTAAFCELFAEEEEVEEDLEDDDED